ncbi:MAG: site-2 protease family protein [Bacteroidia bacterium]
MIGVIVFFIIFSAYALIHNIAISISATLGGVRVEKFQVWFGPFRNLFKKKIGNTEFGLGWLPLGGYVKLAGFHIEDDGEVYPHYFEKLSSVKRLFIIFSGPLSALIVALLALVFFSEPKGTEVFDVIIVLIIAMASYFFALTYLPKLTTRIIDNRIKSIGLYLILVIIQLAFLYKILVEVNDIFPILEWLKGVLFEEKEVHLFHSDFGSINFKALICAIGFYHFLFNLIPTGGTIGGNMMTIAYRSLSGTKLNQKFAEYYSMFSLVITVIIYLYAAYKVFF